MESQKLVIFEANGEEYGIPVEYVISIEKMASVTALPEMEDYVKGLMKVRGELIPVLDVKKILFSKLMEVSDKTRLIVVQTSDLSVGLLVEDAKEILDVSQESIKDFNGLALQSSPYISGMVNLENRLIAIIKPDNLVNSLEKIQQIKGAVEAAAL
ncbi:chemotaxis protein CheW [Sutcliffiella horikoshii]|uniref:chemotaxis protein CheW n=1 Tax=Sutcliffiella horikoshii TaxID=79883 RepID=UPI002041C736|nr:chemotaxis protein CheW [Sutcliffiella horikoshii]MCM3617560.1 chemotaxis protein CheW [Sutcliffiella horikoshii]